MLVYFIGLWYVTDSVQSWTVGCIKDIDGMLPYVYS